MKKWKLLEILFWLIVVVLFVGQIINLAKVGANKETLVVVSEALIGLLFIIVYLNRNRLHQLVSKLPLGIKFVALGYLATITAESLYIFSKPIHKIFLIDLLLVTPFYFLWMVFWYQILKRYRFTKKQAFYLAGWHGFVVEGFYLSLIGWIALPLATALYGFFFIIPYLITEKDFALLDRKEVRLKKKVWLSFVPLVAYLIGFIWIAFLVKTYNLTLH